MLGTFFLLLSFGFASPSGYLDSAICLAIIRQPRKSHLRTNVFFRNPSTKLITNVVSSTKASSCSFIDRRESAGIHQDFNASTRLFTNCKAPLQPPLEVYLRLLPRNVNNSHVPGLFVLYLNLVPINSSIVISYRTGSLNSMFLCFNSSPSFMYGIL